MKYRLNDSPLLQMNFSSAREKSLTENGLCPFERSAFCEALVVSYKHVFNQIRIAQEINSPRADLKISYVPVLCRDSREKTEGVPEVIYEGAEEGQTSRAGGSEEPGGFRSLFTASI